MSDSQFTAPRADGPAHLNLPLPTVIKAIAITGIVLGVIGVGQGILGLVSTLSAGTMVEALIPSLPAPARQPYRELMASQAAWMPLALGASLFSVLASGFLAFSGISSLSRRAVGTLGYAALGAAAADILSILVQGLVRLLTSAQWDAYFSAIATGPAAELSQTTSLVGMLCGYGIIIAFAGFWVWAFTAVSGHAELD